MFGFGELLALIAAYDQLAAALDQLRSQIACCLEVLTPSPQERRQIVQAYRGIAAVLTSVEELLAFARRSEERQEELSDKTLHVVGFALGGAEYGVDIAHVQEINRMVAITRVPRSPQFIEGVINVRGQLIPIIDLRTRFGMDRSEHTKHTRIVVTEVGNTRLGMVVDSVSEVLRIPVKQIENAPDFLAGADTESVRGVGKLGERRIIMLDLSRVISVSEQAELERLDAAA